jgi:hypothetical protein
VKLSQYNLILAVYQVVLPGFQVLLRQIP